MTTQPISPTTEPAPASPAGERGPFTDAELAAIRERFPLLARTVHDKPLVYLDNAATTQRPADVIDAIARFERTSSANVHRGVHLLSQEATTAFESARDAVAGLLGAPGGAGEVVFTRGCTEAVNLVANSWGGSNIGEGDEIVLTEMEHHANIVPWQMLRERTGCVLRVAPVTDAGELDPDALASLIGERTKLVSIIHVSNALGTINPVAEIVRLARGVGARVLVDGAQALAHGPVDVGAIGCDFYTCSAHKAFGPTGIGALWARRELLDEMPPWQGGGEMIRSVTFDQTTYAPPPGRFEAGTPNISGAIGFGAAAAFVRSLDGDRVRAHERALHDRASAGLAALPGVRLVGTAPDKAPVVSFVVEGVHPHDLGTIVDAEGVAIRTGHHCAQPLMQRYGVPATARASFALYNTPAEADALVASVERAIGMFA